MSKESSGGFLSKVVQMVRGPGSGWGDSTQPGAQLTDKQALKAAIERKRRNDFVRKREFDMLRAIRRREQHAQEQVARPSFFQSSAPSEGDGREQTIKKIDAIEAQMSTHWWQAAPGEDAVRASQRLQRPSEMAPLERAAHLQARVFEQTGNTWGTSADSGPPSDVLTQPASEAQWPVPGQVRAARPLPVSFGDETTQSQTLTASRPAALVHGTFDMARCLEIKGVEEAAVRFANGDDAGAEAHLGAALGLAGNGPGVSEVRQLMLDLFRACGRREAHDIHAAEWARVTGAVPAVWRPLGEGGPAASRAEPLAVPAEVWTCPAVLDVAAVNTLAQRSAQADRALVVDWSSLATADATAAQSLLTVLQAWQAAPCHMVWVGSNTLRRSLRASTPSGRRENNPVWWRLRLAVLQLLRRSDEFDLAALDFCVTYGVTPPDWSAPTCEVTESDRVPTQVLLAQGAQRAAPASFPAVRLSGVLSGDVTTTLNEVAHPGRGSGAVEVDCSLVVRTDFVAAGALLQWALALKDSGRPVRLSGLHSLLAVFFHIVGIAEVAEIDLAAA